MAFIGNDMFGHHMHMAAHASQGGAFGQSHSNSAFGASSKKGQASTAFGQANSMNHGHGYDPHTGTHTYGPYGIQHGIFHRQNSLLTDMTASKRDKSRPWVFSSYSDPYGHHHEGSIIGVFEKPLEKPKKPPLKKQESVGGFERRRAPSFASNPEGMRSKTIATGPSGPSTPRKISRSLSLFDDMSEPMNMDLHRPLLRRQQTMQMEKERKRANSLKSPKKSLLPQNLLQKLKNRRSSKASSGDKDSAVSTPHRSRSNTNESNANSDADRKRHDTMDSNKSKSSKGSESEPKKTASNTSDSEQAKLILSLLGPEEPEAEEDTVFLGDPDIMPEEPEKHAEEALPEKVTTEVTIETPASETPTLPLRKIKDEQKPKQVNKSLEDERDESGSITSGKFTPQSRGSSNRSESPQSLTMVQTDEMKPQHDTSKKTSPQILPKMTNIVKAATNAAQPDSQKLQAPMQENIPNSRKSSSSSSSPKLSSPGLRKLEAPQAIPVPLNSDHNRQSPKEKPIKPNKSPTAVLSEVPKGFPTSFNNPPNSRNYGYYKNMPKGQLVMYVDPSDSESSESYYDCSNRQSDSGSPCQSRNENLLIPKRGKKRHARHIPIKATPGTDDDTNSSNGTDTERKPVKDLVAMINKKEHPKRVNDRSMRPQLLSFNDYYGKPKTSNTVHVQMAQQYLSEPIIPQYTQDFRSDCEVKDGNSNDTGTTDSVESGYATSHVQLSPRDYFDQKVMHFVNSLPSNPEIKERLSDCSNADVVQNGSETEDNTSSEDIEPHSPVSEMSGVRCMSGSDSDSLSLDSINSFSKLEVMKVLESPTDVRERINNELVKRSNRSSPICEEKLTKVSNSVVQAQPLSALRKNSASSQTELLKVSDDKKEALDDMSSKDVDDHVEANCVVVVNKAASAQASETQLCKSRRQSSSTYRNNNTLLSFTSGNSYYSAYNNKLTNCIDFLLHFINAVLSLACVGVISVGIWLLLKNFNVNDVSELLGNNLLTVIIYIAISGAGIAILAATCLCCGIRRDKFGLGFYAFVLVLVVLAFTTASVLSAVFADKLYGVEFRFNFKDRLIAKYGNFEDTATKHENEMFTNSWNTLQQEFACCGAEGNVNESNSWAIYKKFSIWYRLNPSKAFKFVPESCCKENSDIEICQGRDHNLLGPPVYGPLIEMGAGSDFTQINIHLNSDGCFGPFASYLSTVATWIAIVMGCLAALYFVTVMLTWAFCFKKNQDYGDDSYLNDSFFDLEYLNDNDVFHDGVEKQEDNTKDGDRAVEETKFISTPLKAEAQPLLAKEPDHGVTVSHECTGDMERDFSKDEYSDEEEEDEYVNNHEMNDITECSEEEYDNDNDTSINTHRRNMWLKSDAHATHLLSIAIEEEDSNFEDSDEDKGKRSAYV